MPQFVQNFPPLTGAPQFVQNFGAGLVPMPAAIFAASSSMACLAARSASIACCALASA